MTKVDKHWGSYQILDEGKGFKVKRISVYSGAALSLQSHQHRCEHWIVVKGTALVTREEETLTLAENESTFIEMEMLHRLENPSDVPLELIEVQMGAYLGEDDIVRYEDRYGRLNPDTPS